MSKFTIEKTNNYTIMSNYHLRDKGLTCKTKVYYRFVIFAR